MFPTQPLQRLFLALAACAALLALGHHPGPAWLRLLYACGLAAFGYFSARRPGPAFAWWVAFLPVGGSLPVLAAFGFFPPVLAVGAAWLGGWACVAGCGTATRPVDRIERAAGFACALVAVSLVIHGLRYGRAEALAWGPWSLEDAVNGLGDTAGAALRGVVLSAAVFVLGPAVFVAVRRVAAVDRAFAGRAGAGLAVGVVLTSLAAVAQVATGNFSGATEHFRALGQANGLVLDPNELGLLLGLAAPLLAGVAARHPRCRWLVAAALAASLAGILASGSRTGLAVWVAGLAVFLALALRAGMFRRRAPRVWAAGLAAAGLVVLAAGLLLFPGARLGATAAQLRDQGLGALVRKDRGMLWQRALVVAGRYPVAGIGHGCYWTEIPNEMGVRPGQAFYRDNAANHYLQVAAEQGLVGLGAHAVLLALVLAGIGRGGMRRGGAVALGGASATAVMLAAFLSGPHTTMASVQVLFWLGVALAVPLPGRDGARPGRVARLLAPPRPLLAAILAVFALWHGASASGPLGFFERNRELGFQRSSGFHVGEAGGDGAPMIWTSREGWGLSPRIGSELAVDLLVLHPDAAAESPVHVRVYLDRVLYRRLTFTAPGESQALRFPVPAGRASFYEVRYDANRAFRPSVAGGTDDRELGVLIHNVQWTE